MSLKVTLETKQNTRQEQKQRQTNATGKRKIERVRNRILHWWSFSWSNMGGPFPDKRAWAYEDFCHGL